MAKSQSKTPDAVEILRQRFIEGNPEMEALVQQEREKLAVAQQIYDLRTEAKLTQKELADLVGTSPSAICRLEDADYEGHSLRLLRKIADALDSRIEVRFVRKKVSPRKVAAQMAREGVVRSSEESAGGKTATAKKRRRAQPDGVEHEGAKSPTE